MEIEKIARQNFARWAEALLAKDAKKAAELYVEGNTFLPTMSPEFKRGKTEAKDYFEHFLEVNPKGEIKEEEVQVLGEKAYIHSGMYNFEVDQDGKRSVIEARFTFVWEKDASGKWKIVHHHSSQKPKA